jgi:hypothetical protein
MAKVADKPRDTWQEALQNTMKHDGNPIYDTVNATPELLKMEKPSDDKQQNSSIYGTILCIDKFRARLQLILLLGGKGDIKGR